MSLDRWKKIELLDLAEKLGLEPSNSSTKAVLVQAITEHLESLNSPLDLEDYPELFTYYENRQPVGRQSEIDDDEDADESIHDGDSDGDSEGDSDSDDSDNVSSEEKHRIKDEQSGESEEEESSEEEHDGSFKDKKPISYFSKLDFSQIYPARGHFEFGFDDFIQDVQSKAIEANEAIQDTLSTIPAIATIFYILELYFYILAPFFSLVSERPYISASVSLSDLLSLVFFWIIFSILAPSFIAYYINFIRYDLPPVEIDPMIFHLSKVLLGLLFVSLNASVVDEATFAVKDAFGGVSTRELLRHWFNFSLVQWKLNLGLFPVVSGAVGVVVCLYVL